MLDGLDGDVSLLLILTGRQDVQDQVLHTKASNKEGGQKA